MTEQEVKAQFIAELQVLLERWSTPSTECTMEAEDHYRGYPECGEDIRITVSIPAIYTESGDEVRPWVEVDLRSYITPYFPDSKPVTDSTEDGGTPKDGQTI